MNKRLLIHITFWITYVLFKTYLNITTNIDSYSETKSIIDKIILALVPQLIYLIIKIPLVYSLFYLMDKFLMKKWDFLKTLCYILIVLFISIILYIVINHIIVLNWFFKLNENFQLSYLSGSITYAFFILLVPISLAITFKLVRSNIQEKQNAQEAIKMQLESELNLLKSQTNPHFLFNTLNNIYGLAIKKSDDTAPVVLKLAQLLRFMIYETKKEQIYLNQEIKLLEDYVELEKIRYNKRLNLTFNSKIDEANLKITPLLLLPLVENAFKHGTSNDIDNVNIKIDLEVKNRVLLFDIENTNSINSNKKNEEGIGLRNLKRQLELCYSYFNIEIINNENIFKVKLKLNLNSYGKI